MVAWSAVILSTSNDQFSATHTGSLLRELFGLPDVVNVMLRKLAHLTGYGILGVLAFWAGRGKQWMMPFAVVILVASTDEWLQSSVPSRGGSPWDVLLDVVGAAIAIGIMIRVQQLRSRRRSTE